MRYAGFWPRLGAILIDSIVLAPVIAVSFWTLTASRTTALLIEVPLALAFSFYSIYFIGRWGQTVGKMALKIRVVRLDGGNVGFTRAFYRHAIDLVFSVITSALTIYALMSVTDNEYGAFSLDERIGLLRAGPARGSRFSTGSPSYGSAANSSCYYSTKSAEPFTTTSLAR